MNNVYLIIGLLVQLNACSSLAQKSVMGTLHVKTQFYNAEGQVAMTNTLKIWFTDSFAIQKINEININTDTANVTTISYTLVAYRFLDARSGTYYDYKSFSDTAQPFNKGFVYDSLPMDMGWNYLFKNNLPMQADPIFIGDTTIDNVAYKKVKFTLKYLDPKLNYDIGYFRCDGKGEMFSLEKIYSKKINCTLAKTYNYKGPDFRLVASKELEFLSESLSGLELNIFEAWKRNVEKPTLSK